MQKQKGINLSTMEFKQKLVEVINTSGLPLCIVQSTISELQAHVGTQLKLAIEAEREAYEKEGESDGKEICKAELAE